MSFDKIIGKIAETLEDDLNDSKTEKVTVGKVHGTTLEKHRDLRDARKELEEEIEERIQELKIQINRQIRNEFKEREREIKKLHRDTWDCTYTELQLDRKDKYSVNTETGEIKKKVKIEKNPFMN